MSTPMRRSRRASRIFPEPDKFMVVDLNGVVSIVDFDGALRHQYSVNTWGLIKMRGSTIHPETCEHVLIDPDFLTVNGLSTFDMSGGGSAKLLMVVANKNNLTTQEEAKKALIESWSYVTELINDNANKRTTMPPSPPMTSFSSARTPPPGRWVTSSSTHRLASSPRKRTRRRSWACPRRSAGASIRRSISTTTITTSRCRSRPDRFRS